MAEMIFLSLAGWLASWLASTQTETETHLIINDEKKQEEKGGKRNSLTYYT